MEYKIEQYERVDTLHEGSIEDLLIGVTKPSIDRLLRMQNPGDCIALYTLYCYIRKWQNNCNVRATSKFVMNALDWGRDRFSIAKNQLIKEKFIEDIQLREGDNRLDKCYVKVRYAMSSTLGKFHTTEIPQCGETSDKYPLLVNEIPFNGNEILMRDQRREEFVLNKKIQAGLSDAAAQTKIESQQTTDSEFETFYSTYPRKVSKTNAEKAWKKQKCVLSEVMPALQKQMKLWTDPQFTPHPATWLNGRRWEDETPQAIPSQQTPYKTQFNANLAQKKRQWYDLCEERGDKQSFKAWVIENRPEEWCDYLPSMDVRWWAEYNNLRETNNNIQSESNNNSAIEF